MTEEHQPQQVAAKEGADLEQAATPASDQADAIGAALAPGSQAEGSTAAEQETPSAQTESEPTQSAEADATQAATAAATKTDADKTESAESAEAGADKTESDETESDKTESDKTESDKTESAEADSEQAESAESAGAGEVAKKNGNVGLLVAGLAGVVVIVLAVLAAFVWPGFLAGPGKPDNQAAAVVQALSSKNAAELDKVTCRGHDGKPVSQIPAKALQMISAVKTTGPTTLSLDTEAIAPLNLTLSQQGKTQDVPVEAVLGVTNNSWCLKGISQSGGQ